MSLLGWVGSAVRQRCMGSNKVTGSWWTAIVQGSRNCHMYDVLSV